MRPSSIPKFGKRLIWIWIFVGVVTLVVTVASSSTQTQALASASSSLLNLNVFLGIAAGTLIGVVVGALPGISPVTAIAVMLPITFSWDTTMALYFLVAITGAAAYAGAVPSILLNVPGDPPDAPICFDGYPMARKGEAGRALGATAMATIVGTIVGIFILIVCIPFVRAVLLLFSAPEFFWLMVAAVISVGFAVRTNMLKGLFAGGIGLLVSLIGFSPIFSMTRFAGNSYFLYDGFELVPIVTGMFALSGMYLLQMEGQGQNLKAVSGKMTGVLRGAADVFRFPATFIRSAIIGTLIGILPGVGGTAAAFICYGTTIQASKHPETFGEGDVEGVIAPNVGKAAEKGAALLPTVAFGIPGSTVMALLLGALMIHGIVPGPLLVRDHLNLVWALILGLGLSVVVTCVLGLFSASFMAKIATISNYYVVPVVIVLCLGAAFAINGNFYDMVLMFIAGLFGFGLKTFGYPIIAFTLGFILGAGTENYFHLTQSIARGSYAPFFTRPIALVECIFVVSLILFPIIQNVIRAKRKSNKMKEMGV